MHRDELQRLLDWQRRLHALPHERWPNGLGATYDLPCGCDLEHFCGGMRMLPHDMLSCADWEDHPCRLGLISYQAIGLG